MDAATRSRLLDELITSDEELHGWHESIFCNWALSAGALRLIAARVQPGDRTLETGSGYSTIVFAMHGAEHTAISPAAFEHDRIRRWCDDHDVPTDQLQMIPARSQDILPSLDPQVPLDFVLIDGDHAFPVPFIDWYFAAGRLRVGGLLLIDDTHLRTGEVLRDFLAAEEGRWRVVEELPTSSLFERISPVLLEDSGWESQPWGATPRDVTGNHDWIASVRARVRLRTRLRLLTARR